MKLIREYINEKFVEDSDPIQDLGIGIIKMIKTWLDTMGIKNYTINNDLTIDVDGSVSFYNKPGVFPENKFPEYIQFRNITNGYFSIANCQLTTLRGCPRTIDNGDSHYYGDFLCEKNKLTSLEFAPEKISGLFDCSDNKVKFTSKEVEKICIAGRGIHV